MRAFVVTDVGNIGEWTKRASVFHGYVFSGTGGYTKRTKTNELRKVVMNRSGVCAPKFFCTYDPRTSMNEMFVAPELARQLEKVEGVYLNDVIFQNLVDVPMPPLGDFSFWTDPFFRENGYDFPAIFKKLPHCPEFEPRFEGYRQIVAAYESIDTGDIQPDGVKTTGTVLDDTPRDNIIRFPSDGFWRKRVVPKLPERTFDPNQMFHYGTLSSFQNRIGIDGTTIEEFPVFGRYKWVLRQDVFEIIAPYLDLDYCGVATLDI